MKVELIFEGAGRSFIANLDIIPQEGDGFCLEDDDGVVLEGNVSGMLWRGTRHDVYPEIFISKP